MNDHTQSGSDEPKNKNPKKSEALWLMSFSDMSLVLLCFFVLMLSTMKPDKEKFKHIKEGITSEKKVKKTDSVKSIARQLKKIIKKKKLENAASITHDSDGLHIEFKDGLMFNAGSAGLKKQSLATVQEVMRVIAKINSDYKINIEGHTDDVPFRGSQFHNWELSADRGFSIMKQLQRLGVPDNRLSVTAYVHTRPKVPYVGLKGKPLKLARASNRCVVIWLE
ncbi:MAG: OmpA family protein [Oligoflexales bacterium]|nr:OmpA family protein [Oligoflexales bacterium]